ncbi:MAG: serine hydrolase domain-containing protein, partial [Eubacteriales bacterium]
MNLSAVNRSMTLLSRLFDPEKSTQAYLAPTQGKPVFSEITEPYFARTAPENEGIPSACLAAFLEKLLCEPALRMHSILLLRHNRVVMEAEFGAQSIRIPKYTFSACKSIVSLCIGILVGDGVLSVEDKLVDLFADRIAAERLSVVQKMRIGSICVRDLLTMRTGIVFNELECQTDPDWVRCYLNSSVSGEPGKTFSYNSLNTYMLSAVICRLTGMSLSEFARQRLFAPLGITDFFWETCPRGIEKGGWGLYIRPEDMAKLGVLVRDHGMWNDTQIVGADYLRDAVTPWVHTPDDTGRYDYGYQIWVDTAPKTYLFNGMLGQNVMIFPDTDIVIVSNAGNDELFQQSPYYDIAAAYFGNPEALSDTALPENPAGAAELRQTLFRIREHTPQNENETTAAYPAQPADGQDCPNSQNARNAQNAQSMQSVPPRKTAFAHAFRSAITAILTGGHTPGTTESANPVHNTAEETGQSAAGMNERAGQAAKHRAVTLPAEALPFLDRTFTPFPAESAAEPASKSITDPAQQTASSPTAEHPRQNGSRTETAADSPDPVYSAAGTPAVGLLPVVLQAVHNAYTKGLDSLSFSKSYSNGDEQLLVTYREQDDTHIFPAGTEKNIRSVLNFCGIPFLIAARCRFTSDEDGRPVCMLRVDFLETPCTRVIKLFLNTGNTAPDNILPNHTAPANT